MATSHRNDVAVIRRVLTNPGTWAVVGLSTNTARPAYGVSRFLQTRLGHRIVPVHPCAEQVHGAFGYASLDAIPDDLPIEVVDCFVSSAHVGAVVDDAIAQAPRLGIHSVWLQVGVVDEEAAARAKAAGLDVVMDTCPRIQYDTL